MTGRRCNTIVGFALAAVICGVVGMSFAAIPLYQIFCTATGYGGTPRIGLGVAPGFNGQLIRILFNADTSAALPWKFSPDQREVELELGDDQIAFYHAVNLSNHAITGQALYNVTPEKVGKYFHKTACFCFNKQTLAAKENMEFPVSFWVDPAIRTDPDTADVRVITLSYTFFRSLEDAEKSGALAKGIGAISATDLKAGTEAN